MVEEESTFPPALDQEAKPLLIPQTKVSWADQAEEDETLEQLEPLDQDKSGLEGKQGLHQMQKKLG
jgi:hypothetical protein